MNQQQRKNYLLRRYMQKRDIEQLRQRQNEMKNQPTFGDKLVSGLNQVKSTYEDLNGINKAKTALDAFKTPKMPSADFASKVGATEGLNNVGQGMNFNAPTANIGANTALTQAPALQTGELASKIGAGSEIVKSAGAVGNTASTAGNTAGAMSGALQGVGKAMPVIGTVAGVASAGNNFAKGNHVDGALDLAKTGAMFIPGVGWAVSGAIQIAQMLKGIFDKKRAKAKAKSQKMAQEEMQNSLEGMQENKQDILNAKADNAQAMAEQLQKNNADTATATGSDVIDPTGINTPTEQQTPLHRADAGTTQGMPQQPLPVDGSASQYNGQEEAYNQAVANMQQPPVPQEEQQIAQAPTEADPKQGIWDILNSKLGNISEVVSSGADKLASIPGATSKMLDKVGLDHLANIPKAVSSGLNDFSAGYKDNTQTSFSQGDLAKMIQQPKEVTPSKTEDGTITGGVEEKKKSIMNRLGELAGTGQRIASHPLTQAGIAGLVSKMAGGEVDDIAKAMYEYGTKKAEADRYYQQTTGKTDRPFLNTYGADDYKTKIQKDEMDRKQANWERDYAWREAQKAKELALREKDIQARIDSGWYKRVGRYGQQKYDPTTDPMFYDDYKIYADNGKILEDESLLDQEADAFMNTVNAGKGWFDKTRVSKEQAKAEILRQIERQNLEFQKKYRINPMKGAKA